METLLNELNVPFQRQVPLGPMTWYGVGGPAKVLARPSSVQQLSALAARCREHGIPIYVLGSGANLLVDDAGVDGVVVHLSDAAFAQCRIEGNSVTVGAGYDLPKLVIDTARAGLAGLDALAGIPASVGGAIRMNAGGTYGDIGSCVRRVQVMDATGQVYYRNRDDLIFGYRHSNIVAKFILEAELELEPEEPEELRRRVKKVFFVKKNSQPLSSRSAGCAFKNLVGLPEDVDPATPTAAGQLIDLAGLKGHCIGGAQVSERHANFIIAHEGCTATDIRQLLEHIEQTVHDRFGVHLEREVVMWP